LDLQGQVVASGTDRLLWPQSHGQVLADAVMRRQGIAVSVLASEQGTSSGVLLGVPVHNVDGALGNVLAGLVSFASAEFEALLQEAVVGETGIVYLVDHTGQVLTSSISGQPGQESSLEGHTGIEVCLQDSEAGATFCQAPDGEQMTLAYAPVAFADAGWRVIIRQPWAEVIGPVLRYSQLMPLVAALAAIVSLLTLYYGVRAIAQPLQALGRRAERVAWGDFDATGAPVGGVEEIEDLRRTLDMMAKRIRTYQNVMRSYIGAMTRGQEEERKRLARELHDDTTQALIALGQQLERTQKLLPEHSSRAAERLNELRTDLVHIVDDVRRFSRNLRPTYLEDLGFIPALEMLTRKADQEGPLSVHFAVAGQVRRLPPDLELACYRIVQEALNNVAQHAKAAHVWLEVHFEADQLVLSIRDDGKGFETPDLPDSLAEQGHFGLVGVRERAFLYGGHLAIRSALGQGTLVTVQLPYPS
jgi:signal transduction histidine kinase